jgi:hypothetical protein
VKRRPEAEELPAWCPARRPWSGEASQWRMAYRPTSSPRVIAALICAHSSSNGGGRVGAGQPAQFVLGAPALVLPGSGGMVVLLVVCLVRGIGFAIAMVAGGALTASLLPADRRGEGLGLLGVVNGIPAVLGLPVGVWLAERYGYAPVFVLGRWRDWPRPRWCPRCPTRPRRPGRRPVSRSVCWPDSGWARWCARRSCSAPPR